MDYNLSDISDAHARALFAIGDDVTIQIFDKDGTDVTPDSPDDVCTAYGELDTFAWPYSNLETLPTSFEEYSWIMTNQTSSKQRDVDSFSIGPATVFMTPFDTDLSKLAINKGDAFEPEIRIDTNTPDLNVVVEFSDGETSTSTTIYKATSDITDRGDGEAGGVDQIKLVAQGDTFQIFRIFLSGDETETFASRFVDMKITAVLNNVKPQTVKKKIPFTETAAIGFDLVP